MQWLRSFKYSARVSECIVASMRERNVAHAECVVLAQYAKGVTELMCAVWGEWVGIIEKTSECGFRIRIIIKKYGKNKENKRGC